MKKKATNYTILIIILSVLLTISLIVGTTFAWFMDRDSATSQITLGDAVTLNIVDREGNNAVENGDTKVLPIEIKGYLLPGMAINVYAGVNFDVSSTPALLRATFDVNINPKITPKRPKGESESAEKYAEYEGEYDAYYNDLMTYSADMEAEFAAAIMAIISIASQDTFAYHLGYDDYGASLGIAYNGGISWVRYDYTVKDRQGNPVLDENDQPIIQKWWYLVRNDENVSDTQNKIVASLINNYGENSNSFSSISFINSLSEGDFTLIFPTKIDNRLANSTIKISVNFQAVQAYLPAFTEGEIPDAMAENETEDWRYNRIKNVEDIFYELSQQSNN